MENFINKIDIKSVNKIFIEINKGNYLDIFINHINSNIKCNIAR